MIVIKSYVPLWCWRPRDDAAWTRSVARPWHRPWWGSPALCPLLLQSLAHSTDSSVTDSTRVWDGDLALKSPLGSVPWCSSHVNKPEVPENSVWWSRSYCISSGQNNALHILLWLSTLGLSYTKLHIDSNIHLLGISSGYTVFMIQRHTLGLAFMCNRLLDPQLQHPRDFRRRYLV